MRRQEYITMKTLVVIPAYNEALNIEKTVSDIENNAPGVDYVVINDGSKDNTLEVIRNNHYNHIDGFCNLGLFGAVQTGFKLALEENYDVVIQFDGDGQHSARYISTMVNEIENGSDIVIGSRFVTEKAFYCKNAR
ncbi:MAG: glycosyltransferase family 2 protein [Intestinibacter bartlettii]